MYNHNTPIMIFSEPISEKSDPSDCFGKPRGTVKQSSLSQSPELGRCHEVKIKDREASRRVFYILQSKKGINELLGSTAKKCASHYLQLKVGHSAVGTHLAKIGVIATSECWWCGQAPVEHLYTKCRRLRIEVRKLIRSLHTEGISWQGRIEGKGLAELLASEKAIGPLLEYLKSTEVGGRDEAKESVPNGSLTCVGEFFSSAKGTTQRVERTCHRNVTFNFHQKLTCSPYIFSATSYCLVIKTIFAQLTITINFRP